ncbi:hypothetical protein SAMN04487897_104176 [Paenibacillus sp. yr247]|uniref:hypothetical protein n=1 Tax=Paenibacillus sp. yr247 TaxID=1761880 RepID=UPI0008901B4C|nr:hypothetical protein [Paenibacillus sp. yr247]SDN71514.1 hypothetical protein SAMN04487897_104176 [Paenibacillus sp. yr247]
MTIPENSKQMNELITIINNCVSMELRVRKSEVESTIKKMEEYDFKYKNSWASMELADHIVIDFWKKDLIKETKLNE